MHASTLAILIVPFLLFPSISNSKEVSKMSAKEVSTLIWGGILYDNWGKEIKAKVPKTTHKAYTSAGKKKGSSTWRCKECHGWDYIGKDGAYKSGSHFSGIKGVKAYAGKPVDSIVKILNDKNHKFKKYMGKTEMQAIASFITDGQIDMDTYIDRSSKKAKGDTARGGRLFQGLCSRCHGADGKKINFKDDKKPTYIGTVANSNPWETLHKIRFGQPTKDMISMLALDIQDQVDVLSYAQTLPK